MSRDNGLAAAGTLLRAAALDDAAAIESIVRVPEVAAWLFRGAAGAADAVGDFAAMRTPRAVHWAATEAGGDVIGGARLLGSELSYFVKRELWGRGYGKRIAREACALAAPIAAAPLSLYILRDNLASRRIAESLGFRFTGLLVDSAGRAVLRYIESSRKEDACDACW